MPRWSISRIWARGAEITLSNGDRLSAGIVVLSAGYKSFAMIEALTGMTELGQGVKGQALIAHVGQKPGLPILYDRTVYVVPHDDGVCAIGSTTEEVWEDEHSTDERCDEIWAKALNLCPMLEGRRDPAALGRYSSEGRKA